MPYFVAAVVLVGLIACLNLLLTYGVIRRLHEHTRMLESMPDIRFDAPDLMLGAGSEPGAFSEVGTTDGEPLTPAALRGTLVGFFSPDCTPCKLQAPRFVERAAAVGRDRALAVAVGTAEATRELVALLEPAARVVVEIEDGPLGRSFGVQGYPAMCLVDDDGRITASSSMLDGLPEPSTA